MHHTSVLPLRALDTSNITMDIRGEEARPDSADAGTLLLGCLPSHIVGLHESVILEIEGFLNDTAEAALALAVQSYGTPNHVSPRLGRLQESVERVNDPCAVATQVEAAVRLMGDFWSEIYRSQRDSHMRRFRLTSKILQQRIDALHSQYLAEAARLSEEHKKLLLALETCLADTASEARAAALARNKALETSKLLSAQLAVRLKAKADRCATPSTSVAVQTDGDASARLPKESVDAQWEVIEDTRRRLAALSSELESEIRAVSRQTDAIHAQARRNGHLSVLLKAAGKSEIGLAGVCAFLELVED